MGTNYYLETDVCECCGRPHDRLHIGKSSAGWCFSLHVRGNEWEPEIPRSLADWQERWQLPKSRIVNEYGETVPSDKMLAVILKRSHPHGLHRHPIDGRHCIAHGDGPYDLITGDFS